MVDNGRICTKTKGESLIQLVRKKVASTTPWQSSYKRSLLANRKYRHMCYLFEEVYDVAIKSSDNITWNPTGEWQLKYYG